MTTNGGTTRLDDADDFMAVARVVCEVARYSFLVHATMVALHRDGGGPAIIVDTLGVACDPYRLAIVDEATYATHPLFLAMRAHGGPVGADAVDLPSYEAHMRRLGYSGQLGYPFAVPLLAPSGVVGSTQFFRIEPFTPALERDLVTFATQVSVRLAQLGVTAVGAARPRLTGRQHEVATLATQGDTNIEIASKLEISTNTVKKLLKDVFQRLDVRTRTELVNALAREPHPPDIPVGVTRLATITVTRGP